MKPQHGITHIIAGASAKLRKGGIRKSGITAKGFDSDRSFMVMEIAGDVLHFQAVSRTGEVFDSGSITRVKVEKERALTGHRLQ
jgi:hypothetical protein